MSWVSFSDSYGWIPVRWERKGNHVDFAAVVPGRLELPDGQKMAFTGNINAAWNGMEK